MNKRNFFRSLALIAGAASISPQIFIPIFEPVRWKPARKYAVINPDWETAHYELDFRGLHGKWNFKYSVIPPARFVLVDGEFVQVARYKFQTVQPHE